MFKLARLGLGGELIRWISNFVSNRKQCVKVNGSFSSFANVDSGVAQGTLLGPLFFMLFISDVSKILGTTDNSIILYADDSKLYGKCNTIEECTLLSETICNLEKWCDSWQLTINAEKSEILRIGNRNLNYPYMLSGALIPTKNVCRDLGVFVGNDLYYRRHYEIVVRNSHFLCKQFRNAFVSKNIEFLMFLFKTYILPKLEYASNVWSPYYKKDVDLIENVQRKFTKFLPGMFQRPYHERLSLLNLITLEERRIYLDLILLYKILHGLIDISFDNYFSVNRSRTRGHPFKLNIVVSRINCHKYHFFNRVIRIWNSLPSDIVTIEKFHTFKNRVFDFDVRRFCIGRAFT